MKDFAVVGSGIGGSAAAALLSNHGHDVTLFEKEPNLGGCSSSFSHQGFRYNTGATTFAGYHPGGQVKALFDQLGKRPSLIRTDPALVVIQQHQRIRRFENLRRFIDEIDRVHPHPKNSAFWKLVKQLNDEFYAFDSYTYSKASVFTQWRSLTSFWPLLRAFHPYLFTNAQRYIQDYFGGISRDYLAFMNAQVLIVAQTSLEKMHFLTAALALGYTFSPNHYANGGMGSLFDLLCEGIREVRTRSRVTGIERRSDHFLVQTPDGELACKNIILNSTVYDSARLFEDAAIKRYYQRLEPLNNHQSAFVLYLTIRTSRHFHHHYQLLMDERPAQTISNALFVSLSDQDDRHMAPPGHYSVTASIHTDARWWSTPDPDSYRHQKRMLQEHLVRQLCDALGLATEEIVQVFSATPRTFGRYLLRTQLGGNAMSMRNHVAALPSNDTPFRGLYQVGDSTFAAQGWPGVMQGVTNLMRLLDK